jgi:hypothetical protein
MKTLAAIFRQPIGNLRSLGFVLITAIVVVFMLEVPPGDWYLNAQPITTGLAIYENPNYVYPPWSLLLFWPYYLLHVQGTRIAFVLILAFLAHRSGWSLGRFMAIIFCPIFLYSVGYTNIDLLVLTLPLVLWDTVREKSWAWLVWGLLLAVMLLKPQGAILVILYLFWQERQRWRELLYAVSLSSLILLPMSLLGSPPLLVQWLDNIMHPSEQNQLFWRINNLSLSQQFGFPIAALILLLGFGLLFALMRWRGKTWTKQHTWAGLLAVSSFLSPYMSLQSTIALFAFIPSWPSLGLQLLFAVFAGLFKSNVMLPQLWFLGLALASLWFAPNKADVQTEEGRSSEKVLLKTLD